MRNAICCLLCIACLAAMAYMVMAPAHFTQTLGRAAESVVETFS